MTTKKVSELDNNAAVLDTDQFHAAKDAGGGSFTDEKQSALEIAEYVLDKVGLTTSDLAVKGPGTSVSGNISSFNGTGGDEVQDSGISVANSIIRTPTLTLDNGDTVIDTGAVSAKMIFTYACTLTNYYIESDLSGNVVIDVKRNGTSIVGGGGNKPTLSGATSANAALSGWTSVAIAAGDILTFNVDTCSAAKHVDLAFKATLSS